MLNNSKLSSLQKSLLLPCNKKPCSPIRNRTFYQKNRLLYTEFGVFRIFQRIKDGKETAFFWIISSFSVHSKERKPFPQYEFQEKT